MIDYKKLKQIFPNGLPEAHIFFAHREVSDVMKISYATLRRETGYRSTNRGAWVRFVKKFNDETSDVPVDSIALTLPSSVEVGKKISGLVNILPTDATIGTVELAISDVTKATGVLLQTPTTGTPNGSLEVTGKEVGTVTVSVLCDGKVSNTVTVTVKAAVVAVTGVTVTPTTAALEYNKTQQLTPTIAPPGATNKAVTYTTSDATVATVSATGLVTALSKDGTATITVKTTDGNKTATCVVTVRAPAG